MTRISLFPVVACFGFALIGCQTGGSVPTLPPILTPTAWRGASVSIDGSQDFALNLNETGGTVTGLFTLDGGLRKGSVSGRIVTDKVTLTLVQSFPCSAQREFSGTMTSDGEFSGLWSGRECDGRAIRGALVLVEAKSRSAATPDIDGSWSCLFTYGSVREAGKLRLVANGAAVTGTVDDVTGARVGIVAGTLGGDLLHLVVQRFTPCSVTRSVTAVVAEEKQIDGSWRGETCDGATVSAGRLTASRD